MAKFTKEVIKSSFLKLLEEKPYTKISVRDIVEECNINRNSFYYHYQDIPTLLREIIQEQTDDIIRRYPSIDSVEDSLSVALEFALQNKRAVLHIYNSVSRDLYEQHLWALCDYAIRTYFNSAFSNRQISDADLEIIIRHLKSELFGTVSDWLETGMKADVESDFHRLCELKKGQTEEMIRRCEKTKCVSN